MWCICTVHTSAVTSLVSCELEKVQNYSVMWPKTLEISHLVRSHKAILYKNGENHCEIAKKVGFTFSVVRYVIKWFLTTKSLVNDHRRANQRSWIGLKADLLSKIRRKIHLWVLHQWPLTSCYQWESQFTRRLSGMCFIQPAFMADICGKKTFISEANCDKRLTFAKEYVNKPSSFWQNVIFSNESKYNLFRSDRCGYVWRKKIAKLRTKNLLPTVKFGGGKVLMWGCMAASGGEIWCSCVHRRAYDSYDVCQYYAC